MSLDQEGRWNGKDGYAKSTHPTKDSIGKLVCKKANMILCVNKADPNKTQAQALENSICIYKDASLKTDEEQQRNCPIS